MEDFEKREHELDKKIKRLQRRVVGYSHVPKSERRQKPDVSIVDATRNALGAHLRTEAVLGNIAEALGEITISKASQAPEAKDS